MADVYTVTFIVIGMLLSLPGLLVGLNLLMPNLTQRIETRISEKPGRNLFVGVPITAAFALWIAVASNTGSGVLRGSAFLAGGVWMALGTIGAAGLARMLGNRLKPLTSPTSELTNLVRGAVVFEFACLFPLVGWFVFAPIIGIMLVGAAFSSLRSKSVPIVIVQEQSVGVG
ncbi:MAG: hypothetical protein AAF490_23175 [Chloroflexota bacterium]